MKKITLTAEVEDGTYACIMAAKKLGCSDFNLLTELGTREFQWHTEGNGLWNEELGTYDLTDEGKEYIEEYVRIMNEIRNDNP